MKKEQLVSAQSAPTSIALDNEYVCWSRMQAEAGQELSSIVRRKEYERGAGKGIFYWGIGTAPALAVRFLAGLAHKVPVVFSVMKSRPRKIDLTPSRVVVWQRYIDLDGRDHPLPGHVLITSRADGPSGPKQCHYALVCHSNSPLVIQHADPFDPSAYRNVSSKGAAVGASQVTALLRRFSSPTTNTPYKANITAQLIDNYWVKLIDPLPLCNDQVSALRKVNLVGDNEWLEFVSELRGTPKFTGHTSERGTFALSEW